MSEVVRPESGPVFQLARVLVVVLVVGVAILRITVSGRAALNMAAGGGITGLDFVLTAAGIERWIRSNGNHPAGALILLIVGKTILIAGLFFSVIRYMACHGPALIGGITLVLVTTVGWGYHRIQTTKGKINHE